MSKNSFVRNRILEQGAEPSERTNEKDYSDAIISAKTNLHTQTAITPDRKASVNSEYVDAVNDEFMASEETKAALKKLKRKKLYATIEKITQVVISVGCLYLVFLIYGAMNTEYIYDAKGNVVPQVLSVEQIKEVNEFNTMHTNYIQAQKLYEKVLTLDYRMALGYEDPLLIAPEYEKLLDDISTLSVQMGAITVPAKYTQPMNMLLSWVQNDIALYCQYMSRAITQNNVSDMNKAYSYKDTMYVNFQHITQVVATLGSTVENADISDVVSWSPEAYLQSIMNGGAQ